MTTIFVVDDNPFMTERIGALLEAKLKGRREAPTVVTEDEYIWEVATDERFGYGDIVLSDLYPAGYWMMDRPKRAVVSAPRQLWPWRPVDQNHPTRIATAVEDIIRNYMTPLAMHKHKPAVIIYTHVLMTLYDAGMIDEANRIKDLLRKCVVRKESDILEKVDRVPANGDLDAVADYVLRELDALEVSRNCDVHRR